MFEQTREYAFRGPDHMKMKPAQNPNPWPEFEAGSDDGRRQRSDRSRQKIIEAMFHLLREGSVSPTATAVAERAEVGLRTVFRHFADMESIFEEMAEQLSSITMPMVVAPYQATHWRDRLMELVERNAKLYELIFPLQVALVIRRFESDFLQRQYMREVNLLRAALKSVLPAKIVEDRIVFAAIEVNLTFATWRRLRQDQNLSVETAATTLKHILQALIKDIQDA